MTTAICIRCGVRKRGALTPCGACSFLPTDNLDKAKAVILTDHFLGLADLDHIGERIRTGQPVTYPEEALADYVALFERGADRMPRKVLFACIGAVMLVAGVLAYLALRTG